MTKEIEQAQKEFHDAALELRDAVKKFAIAAGDTQKETAHVWNSIAITLNDFRFRRGFKNEIPRFELMPKAALVQIGEPDREADDNEGGDVDKVEQEINHE
jgi:hypothetical protein